MRCWRFAWVRCVILVSCMALAAAAAWAGGPRFISGTSGFTTAGLPMAWYTGQPMYFTDPGDLSATVTHAQADAMVAAAAAVWNIPTANVTLAQGGELAEHVAADGSSPNAIFNGTDVVWPTDVEATNYQAIQIPVIYDSDGSVIDLLLGSGASTPSEFGCLDNGVVESVDQFGSDATIQHAVIVLNGLCVGSNPNQLTQMQYQLTRVFGRVLGLAWSQLNDSVFTGTSEVTAAEMALWPLMHPIDVVCGPYTYMCMTNPFTLRPDDMSALASLYPVTVSAGSKTQSNAHSISVSGAVTFPTGQGMELVNVLVMRNEVGLEDGLEPYPILSSTTGYPFQQNGGSAVSGTEPAAENGGTDTSSDEGTWKATYLAAPSGTDVVFPVTETINPLYFGEFAVGPYQRPVISMSGTSTLNSTRTGSVGGGVGVTIPQGGTAASSCATGSDGTQSSPVAFSATGWWSGRLCSTGHTSWWEQTVNANTSWTIEATALDEAGAATVQKAQPVIGVWNTTDATGTLPTVASQATALNSLSLGTTQLRMPATASVSALRIAIADQFGAGRPDFAYEGRILYASGVSPASVGMAGGQITITGMGFQAGNEVLVKGVMAEVTSWTDNQIVATAPSMAAVGAVSGTAVDVEVLDPGTGGSTEIRKALTFTDATKDVVALVSAPSALETGLVAATPFAVRVFEADGATPAAGASVSFTVVGSGGGAAVATGCGPGTGCVVKTDATGLAATPLMGVAAGSVTVSGTEMSGGSSVHATIADTNPVQVVTIGAASQYLAAGAAGSWTVSLTATQDGAAAAGVPVMWSTSAAGFTLTPSTGVTAANGTEAVVAAVSSIAGGASGELANVVTGCAFTNVCANWTVFGVAPSLWTISVSSGGGQGVVQGGVAPSAVVLQVTDGAGHALPGAAVNVYQTAYAWEGVCGLRGACASAPVLKTTRSTAVSDGNGMVQVTPMVVPGVPQVVRIAAATGTKGFATTSVTVAP
jgi:IPT/TIG domain